MEKMNESPQEQEQKSESVSRSHSQELLDYSSVSSISISVDHSDGQINNSRTHDNIVETQKPEENSQRAPMDEVLKSEAAFIKYLTSIPPKESSELYQPTDSMSSRNRSPVSGAAVSKVGLDHLDNLCKLMEQLGELRDNNTKLQKRVQYLEDLKTLHDMHKEIFEGQENSSEDPLSSKSEGPYKLKKSATESNCPHKEEVQGLGYSRSPSKYLSRRSRHQQSEGQRRGRSKSVGHEDLNEDSKSRRLFPKWSKVKEAFGWESERKDSIKTKSDSGTIFTSRRRSDESSRQTHRSPSSPTWYHDYPSIHSSMEDINEELEGRWKKNSVPTEKFHDNLSIPHEGLRRQKSTPSPSSDKVPSYRHSTELKPKSFTIERDSYRNQDFSKFEKEDGKRGKSPWGRVKTIIERHRDSLKRRSLRHDPSVDLDSAIGKSNADSLDFKDYADYVEPEPKPMNAPRISKQKGNKPDPIVLDEEFECGGVRTPSSSPTNQRKSKWTRMTKALKGKREGEKDAISLSTPTSPNNQQDGNFTFDIIEEASPDSYRAEREISRVGSDSHVHQMALSVPSSDLMLQLQRNLSEDFHRKIQEWDRIRATGNPPYSPQWDRKPSVIGRTRKKSERQQEKIIKPKIKDLTWLEKELQKVEREKQRLSKERLKYEQRALRLEKLKETVLGSNSKRDVLVRTSAGEFRFEGISDAFTKKLYEWETKKGVGPEFSTIALLDSSKSMILGGPGTMQRMLSKSESSIADIGHNSLNSLPSVKLPDSVDADRQNHPSRANSVPDLSALAAAFGNNLATSNEAQNTNESLDDDLTSPDVNKDSEEDELDKQRKGSETYYGLLEENVILLEQLKEKEEICRRLERDLEILDEKMDEMNAHHIQETQRYREKLWELHQQGASPRDVLCCRRTMEQLRKRIEVLEKWTKKLRTERDTVEVDFWHHSREQESMTLDLLEKMRELQVVGSSTAETESRSISRMDTNTIEKLQDLSALLTKQTQDLQETLNKKTHQICQLKWELLHRDLSTVKQQTEQHNHSAQKKRSKYAHWRSRSTEEQSVSNYSQQKIDPVDYKDVAADVYCIPSPEDELKATNLVNTVQQLSKEVLKLTSSSSISSLPKCVQDESTNTNVMTVPKNIGTFRSHMKVQCLGKPNMKRITVRRNSADSLSLISTDDSRRKEEHSSSSHSDDSSDEYFSRICYNTGIKTKFPNNSDAERLLLSYGEYPPRTQRKKKLQRISKLNSSLGRRRSNTFHTNRDLQKPTISENAPQKCHSFRVARENYWQDRVINKTPYIQRKFQNLNFGVCTQSDISAKTLKPQNIKEAANIKRRFAELRELRSKTDKTLFSEDYNNKILREVASDSKIPLIMQLKKYTDSSGEREIINPPIRSMSDKTKQETATEKREYIQKKKLKKRLKSPEVSKVSDAFLVNESQMSGHDLQKNLTKHDQLQCSSSSSLNQKENESPKENHNNSRPEIPTITIQLPKRKQRKPTYSNNEAAVTEEQSFTIVMPKKRSLSSECDSSISESSPREESKMSHSDKISSSSISSDQKHSTVRSHADSFQLNSNATDNENSKGNIRLMKLVSLDNFDTPFENNKFPAKDSQQNEHQPRKRKVQDGDCSGKNSPSEEMIDMITAGTKQIDSNTLSKSNTTEIDRGSSIISKNYIKSPSAPQLDWRKTCAKKISRSGAPNVKTLIERYNQKLVESQTSKSPFSSNVNSPTTIRKISTPNNNCFPQEYIPHFSSTPNTPVSSPSYTPLTFRSVNLPYSPPSSPLSLGRNEALRRAREDFIASPQVSTPNSPVMLRTVNVSKKTCLNSPSDEQKPDEQSSKSFSLARTRSAEDRMSNCSMDSMSLVMLRAGENCKESRMPKRPSDSQKDETTDKNNLKPSKSLSSSSIFKAVLHSDFKMPTNLLKLKRSKRKKDMSAVSELCRQSLLLASDEPKSIPTAASHKSCPSSPELKSKTVVKSNWLQRNIFRHK